LVQCVGRQPQVLGAQSYSRLEDRGGRAAGINRIGLAVTRDRLSVESWDRDRLRLPRSVQDAARYPRRKIQRQSIGQSVRKPFSAEESRAEGLVIVRELVSGGVDPQQPPRESQLIAVVEADVAVVEAERWRNAVVMYSDVRRQNEAIVDAQDVC